MLVLGNACIFRVSLCDTWLKLASLSSSPVQQLGKATSNSPWPLPKGVSVSFLVWHQGCKILTQDTATPCPYVSSQTAWPGRGPLRMKKSSKESAGEGTGACCPPHRWMKNLLVLGKTPAQLPAGVWGPASISFTHDAHGLQLAALFFSTLS